MRLRAKARSDLKRNIAKADANWASDYAKTYPGTAMRSRKTSKRHEVPARNLKSPKKKKLINAKDALKVVFDGKKRATMFKARTHISGHLR
jgi:hypothetical protein